MRMKLRDRSAAAALVGLILMIQPLLAQASAIASKTVHHDIKLVVNPGAHFLEVEDTVTLPESFLADAGREITFSLHGGLNPLITTPGAKLTREKEHADPLNGGLAPPGTDVNLPVETYRVALPDQTARFTVKYSGQIHHPVQEEFDVQNPSETAGAVSSEGIYLAASSFWYPILGESLISFSLNAQIPEGWDLVSQGERTQHLKSRDGVTVRWESPEPQEEIFLVGNRFTEYRRTAGAVTAMAFLKAPDQELAEKYLEVTHQYLEMYQKMIGPYPYKKFVLVENFWDSGYGMPSFTLLGPKIIRFPFILHSSYPHEILHNWWGNGVYVDYQGGNWAEGLTAYLADHLVSEQRGSGAESRRKILQDYIDYVSEGKDFPVTAFRSRHSSATAAIGYGKTMMFFHMLRRQLGDGPFVRGLQLFYGRNKFRRAGFDELEQAFNQAAGKALKTEFKQWLTRTGAPALRLSDPLLQRDGPGYLLKATLDQIQPGLPYSLEVPIALTLEGQDEAYQTTVVLKEKRLELSLKVPARPLRIDVDPEFDIFRRLERDEIPPALSQALGAPKILILLPSAAAEKVRNGYRQVAETWKKSLGGQVDIQSDVTIAELPGDRAVWLFGWENRFLPTMKSALAGYDTAVSDTAVRIGQTEIGRGSRSIVLTARNPGNPDVGLAFLATDNVAAMPGLGRKLPHYGRYSYLGFEGAEPENILKGEWPVVSSPMTRWIPKTDGTVAKGPRAKGRPRSALASLPPLFPE
jgi:aminopeptidase N